MMVSTWLAMVFLVEAFSSYEEYNLQDRYEDTNLEDSYEDYNLGESFEDAALGESFEDAALTRKNRNDVQRLAGWRDGMKKVAKKAGKGIAKVAKHTGKGMKTVVDHAAKQMAKKMEERMAVDIAVKLTDNDKEVLFVGCVLETGTILAWKNRLKVYGKNGKEQGQKYKCRARIEFDASGASTTDYRPQTATCAGPVNERNDKLKEVNGCSVTYTSPEPNSDDSATPESDNSVTPEPDVSAPKAYRSNSRRQVRRKLSDYERYF